MLTKYIVVGTALNHTSVVGTLAHFWISLKHCVHKTTITNLPKTGTGPTEVAHLGPQWECRHQPCLCIHASTKPTTADIRPALTTGMPVILSDVLQPFWSKSFQGCKSIEVAQQMGINSDFNPASAFGQQAGAFMLPDLIEAEVHLLLTHQE